MGYGREIGRRLSIKRQDEIAMRNWLIAFGLCVVAIFLSIQFVDFPVAIFLNQLPSLAALHSPVFGLPIFAGVCGLALVGFAIQRGLGGQVRAWEETTFLIVLSLSWAISITEDLLKPLCGRPLPYVFFSTGKAQFHFWRWALDNSFPSGHAAQIASVMTVLWITYPRLRGLWGAMAVIGYLLLILGNWHFVSDVIAGAFLGTFGATMIVALWRNRAALS
jgi:membrane-associated phospholipid phosphatase